MSKKATINTQTKVSKAPLPSVKISVKKSTKSKKPANDIKKILRVIFNMTILLSFLSLF